jgi:serine kinase of HPr protein (carbohydrate metabolism regulator)
MEFRLARHANNLNRLIKFYTAVLNFEILGSFESHSDYNGVFLGKKELDWHIEFTESNEKANQITDADDLLVFYPKSKSEYKTILDNIKQHKIAILKAKNSYWNQNGILIQDPDGFYIVISHLKIK